MKVNMTVLMLLFSSLFFALEVNKNPTIAKFKFESEVHDYGTIPFAGDGRCEFKFTNVGKEPLVISNVQSSCGCLVPSYPKEPIAPGKSNVIKAYYDTKRVGQFEKTLTVTSNSDRPSLVLKIKGKVLPESKDSTEVAFPGPKAAMSEPK